MRTMQMLLAAALVTLISTPVFAQARPAVEVTGVPERLYLPLPDGANQVLTASLADRQAQAAWISPVGQPQVRYMLNPAGDGKFKLNLANETVWSVLEAVNVQAFRVYLRPKKGRFGRSIKINFARLEPKHFQIKAAVTRDGKENGRISHQRRRWYAPARCRRVIVQPATAQAWPEVAEVYAVIGDESVKLAQKQNHRYVLRLNKAQRQRWRQHGSLVLESRYAERSFDRLTLKARPGALVQANRSNTFVVFQRRSEALPGSHGYLTVELGDITGGQVRTSIKAADGQRTIKPVRSLRQGESMTFEHQGVTYRLTIKQMVNQLIGSDHCEFELTRAKADDRP